jgi:hypothetical protein
MQSHKINLNRDESKNTIQFDDKDKASHILHVQFLQFMITNINFNITTYKENHEAIKLSDIMTLTDPEKYKNNFDINVSGRDKQEVIIQTIHSNSTLPFINKQPGRYRIFKSKQNSNFDPQMDTNNCDVNVVGFLSPSHHPKDYVLATINSRLNKQNMPQFRIKQTRILRERNKR